MKKILKKIPLIFWATLLSVTAFFAVKLEFITGLNTEQIRLFSGFLTVIGLIFVAVNLQRQWKNERIKTEYLNQPDFFLKGFATKVFKDSGPVLCPNPQECNDDHWLNLIQTGNLAARKLKIGLFYKNEAETDIRIQDRWLTEERLGKNDEFQYVLPPFKIPIKYFDASNRMCFLLLMEYKSEYSNIKYKRIYQLCASATGITDVKENDWKKRIAFYNSSLINTLDSDSITTKQILKSYWFKITRWLGIKKDFTDDEWLIEL